MLPLALFLRHTEFWFFLAWQKGSREGSDTILNWPVAWWWEYSPGKQETWIGIPLLPLGLGHDVTSFSTATSKPLVGLALTERLTVHTSTGMRINQKPASRSPRFYTGICNGPSSLSWQMSKLAGTKWQPGRHFLSYTSICNTLFKTDQIQITCFPRHPRKL